MDYVICIVIGLALGIFACVTLYALIVAHPAQPGWDLPPVRREPPLMPGVAKMPVVEAGCVSYQFLGGVTGLEDE